MLCVVVSSTGETWLIRFLCVERDQSEDFVKILLRNKLNGTYFKGINAWTRLLDKAFDFQRPERAIRFVRAAHLDPAPLEIVFGFSDPHYNMALPIDDRFDIKTAAVVGSSSIRAGLADAGDL